MSRGRGRDITDDGEPVRIKQGRRAPYTQLGDWVMLAPVSVVRHAAKVLYWSLSAHLTVKQDDDTPADLHVNPTLEMLAAMLGYSSGRKLLPYLDDLVALGAIDVDTDADDATVARLIDLTERYCVIAQTLAAPPPVHFVVAQSAA